MSWQDAIGGLLQQYAQGARPNTPEEAEDHYDQIHQATPPNILGSILGPALASLGSQEVQGQVANSANAMSPDQRGSLVGGLLQGLSQSGADIPALLSQLGVSQNVATDPSSATPEEVGQIAAHAQEADPGVFSRAMEFYTEHPTLVKALGTAAIAAITYHLAHRSDS